MSRISRNLSGTLIMCILFAKIVLFNAESFEEQKNLHEYLEKNIHRHIRPILNQSNTMNVNVQFSVLSVQGLDEKTQILSSTVGIVMTWICETLRWNSSEFGNAGVVRLSANEIWLPDIAIYNSIDNNQILNMEDEGALKVSLKANGHALWSSGGNFDTTCKVDITNYPFDTQVCKYIVGKYFSSDDVLTMEPVSDKMQMPSYVPNDVWHLEKTEISEEHVSTNYSKIVVRVTLTRRPLFYILNVILPVCVLSFMNVLSFKLPVTSGERVSYCVALFLTFMVLLDTISDAMPKVSQTVSYLQMYVNIQMAIGMIITAISIILVQMSVNWNDEHVPTWVQKMYRVVKKYKRMDRINRIDTVTSSEFNDLPEGDLVDNVSPIEIPIVDKTAPKPSDPRETIKQLDQVFFVMFTCLFVLTNVLFGSCMLTYTSEK